MPLHTFTKIVSSIGPASSSPEVLERLIKNGVDVCRLNFSHGTHEDRSTILIDDGRVSLKVDKISSDKMETTVLYGNELSNNKGFNIPDTPIKTSALTPKDIVDLKFSMSLGVDFVALSFVQKVEDILELKKILKNQAKIIIKVEKPSACEDIVNITKESDVIMIARGDLATETSHAEIPILQRKMIETSRSLGKPVIVATDVFDSMIKSPAPTRAEVSDCATAVYLGADAIMTSGETAVGNYPERSIDMMGSVISSVENSYNYRDSLPPRHTDFIEFRTDEALALSSADVTDLVKAKVIVAFTHSGSMASKISSYRPEVPILALTIHEKTANQLSLTYGVRPILLPKHPENLNAMEDVAVEYAKSIFNLKKGDKIVMTAGKKKGSIDTLDKEGNTNLLTIINI